MVRVSKIKSVLFCLRDDPLIVFWRQNHVTFIFIKNDVTWPPSASGLFHLYLQIFPNCPRYFTTWSNIVKTLKIGMKLILTCNCPLGSMQLHICIQIKLELFQCCVSMIPKPSKLNQTHWVKEIKPKWIQSIRSCSNEFGNQTQNQTQINGWCSIVFGEENNLCKDHVMGRNKHWCIIWSQKHKNVCSTKVRVSRGLGGTRKHDYFISKETDISGINLKERRVSLLLKETLTTKSRGKWNLFKEHEHFWN